MIIIFMFLWLQIKCIAKGKFLEKDMHCFHEEMQKSTMELWSAHR